MSIQICRSNHIRIPLRRAFAEWPPRPECLSLASPEAGSKQVSAPAMRPMHRRHSQSSAWADRSPPEHVFRCRTSAPTANESGFKPRHQVRAGRAIKYHVDNGRGGAFTLGWRHWARPTGEPAVFGSRSRAAFRVAPWQAVNGTA